jgi:hypothetical protein
MALDDAAKGCEIFDKAEEACRGRADARGTARGGFRAVEDL